MPQQTPFYSRHLTFNAKMVDFNGWELPVQYTSISQEHIAVRTGAGLFDISHMGQLFVWGVDAETFLQKMVTNDVTRATEGSGIYAHLLNEQGTIIDDIYVFRLEADKFLLIVNASRKEADTAWLEKNAAGLDLKIMEAPQAAGLALQGPQAVSILDSLNDQIADLRKNEIGEFPVGEVNALISRTGYTGEDGFELFAPAGHLLLIWDQLFKANRDVHLTPCGLGARDTLRTEVGYPLYGHELDETHTPLDANLSWVVKFDKGPFMGRDALLQQKSAGLKVKLFGFRVETGGVARPGGKIYINGAPVSEVASGTFSPTLGIPIGTAYLPADTPVDGAALIIRQGSRELTATTVKMPFYKRGSHAQSGSI